MLKSFQRRLQSEQLAVTETLKLGSERKVTVMLNPVRREIFTYLCRFPCSTLSALRADLELHESVIRWHLAKLISAEFVERRIITTTTISMVKSYPVYLPTDWLNSTDIELLSILNRKEVRKLLLVLHQRDGSTQTELRKATKLNPRTITKIFNELELNDVVNSVRDGREVRYYLTPLIKKRAEMLKPWTKKYKSKLIFKFRTDGFKPQILVSTPTKLHLALKLGTGTVANMELKLDPYQALFSLI